MPDRADQIALGLIEWLRSAAPDVDVEARSCAQAVGQGVEVRLVALQPSPSPRTANPPSVLALDYLVTVRLTDGLAEQAAAAELMFAAVERQDVEVVTDHPALQAAGLAAAGFVLRTHLAREKAVERAPLVRFPLRAEFSGLGRLHGQVLGPGDIPIANASVTAIGLNRSTQTGPDGRFEITGPLPNVAKVRLNARARGVEIEVVATAGQPTVLHLPLEI